MMSSLRILHVSEAFTGGIFASVTGLANGLAERGHEVHLAFSRRPETPADVRAFVHPSIVLHELALVRPISPREDWAGFRAIRRLIREVKPDILHVHSSKAGVLGRLAARSTGLARRTFYSPRALSFLQENQSPQMRLLYEKIEWSMARVAGTVVACSESELALVRERVRPRRAELIENAIDVDKVRPRKDRADGRVRVGTVGRVAYAKNPQLYARLAQHAASRGVEFIWIGAGEAEDTRTLEAAGVRVTGWLPRASVLDELASLDVYLHPSLWEGMPIALIEAQVCGLPSIAHDAVGNRDIIRHGETGFIGVGFDELAAHLDRLIDDADLRHKLGERARETGLARFRLERVVDQHERLYRSV
jgi:glycosyltransferase involved in cell wall biosynthesis